MHQSEQDLDESQPSRTTACATIDELLPLIESWRNQQLIIGFTCGAFDLLHAGHADYLEQAAALCDRLVVGVNSDDSIRRYKNPLRPIVAQQHRLQLIASLRSVSAAVIMNETRPTALIEAFHPDIYIKGGDYSKTELRSAPLVESYGGRCVLIPVKHEISSSRIIHKIEELSLYAAPSPAGKQTGPVVFLDRDGTLIENLHFLKDPARVKLLDGVGEALRNLQDNGFRLALVTNQQGLGVGYFDYESFVATNSALFRQLAPFGVKIGKVYFCPHSFAEECDCRKPGSKLIERGLADFAVKAADCFMVGDAESDMLAASKAGCHGILLADPNKSSWQPTVRTLADASELILQSSRNTQANSEAQLA